MVACAQWHVGLEVIARAYDQGETNYFYRIWNLFTLAYWYDYWVEGRCG